jgi:hypothetical protein
VYCNREGRRHHPLSVKPIQPTDIKESVVEYLEAFGERRIPVLVLGEHLQYVHV